MNPYAASSYAAANDVVIRGQERPGSQIGSSTSGLLMVPRLEVRLSAHEALEIIGSLRRDETSEDASDWMNEIVEALRVDYRSANKPYSKSELETDRRLRMTLRSSRLGAIKLALGGEISQLDVSDDNDDTLFLDPTVDYSVSTQGFTLESSDRTFAGLFGEAFGELGPISLFVGARLDHAGKLQGRDFYPPLPFDFEAQPVTSFVPRAVLTWEVISDHIFKLAYQEAFRNPTPNNYSSWSTLLVRHTVIHNKYAPPLQPEKAQYFDMAYRISDLFLEGLSLDVVASYTINNATLGQIDWSNVFPGVLETEGDPAEGKWQGAGNEARASRSIAADVVVGYRWRDTKARLVYDYARPVHNPPTSHDQILVQWDGKTWNAFPRHLFKLRISHALGPCTLSMAWRGAAGVLNRGTAETPLTASDQPPETWIRKFPQWRMDAAVSLQLLPALHLTAFIKNIGTRTRYRRGAQDVLRGAVFPGPDAPLLGLALEYSEKEDAS